MSFNAITRFYRRHQNIFDFNIKYLSLVGLWPPEDLSLTKRILYKTYEIILNVFAITLIVISGIGMYHIKDNTILLILSLDKNLAAYNFTTKSIIFITKRYKIRNLIGLIENSGDEVSEKRKELMAKYVILITILTVSVVAAFTCLSLYEGELVTVAWMPFDPFKNKMSFMISNQILAILFVSCCLRAFAMKGLVCSLIIYLCDQLDELRNNLKILDSKDRDIEIKKMLKTIVKKHIRLMSLKEFFNMKCNEMKFKLTMNLNPNLVVVYLYIFISATMSLKDFILGYMNVQISRKQTETVHVISYSKSMEIIFKEYFLVQNLAVSVELCLNAIMMTVTDVQQITLQLTFSAYLCLALLNAYIYSYLGNELMTKSEGIALEVYNLNWTSWPVDLQKDVLIIIMAAQRPFKLTAGGVALVSIQTFSQTLYNGYTIFAVLNDIVN